MKIETTLNHNRRFKSRIIDLYRQTKHFCLSSDEHIQNTKKLIYDDPTWKKLPRWAKEYLRGYMDAKYDGLWAYLEWVFPWKGEIYHYWEHLPEDGRNYYMQKDKRGLHVWKSNNQKHYTGTVDQYNAGL